MKPQLLTVATVLGATLLLPGLALADIEGDANGDGALSLEELQAVMPEVSEEAFVAMDANGNAVLEAEEIDAARAAGLLPSRDG